MKKSLSEIVNSFGVSPQDCVRLDRLYANTIWQELSTLDQLDWNKVECLYILGGPELPDAPVGDLEHLPRGLYTDPTGAWVLLAGPNLLQIQYSLINCTPFLEKLQISHTAVDRLVLPKLPRLQKLYLTFNTQLRELHGLGDLRSLRELNLCGSALEMLLELDPFHNLKLLVIDSTRIRTIKLEHDLPQLQSFSASETDLADYDFLDHMKNLVLLDLDRSTLSNIPEAIRHMRFLESLYLQHLTLKDLPDWLPELNMNIYIIQHANYGIYLTETTVEDVDMSIFHRPRNTILAWFEERKTARQQKPLNEIKVVFLGDGEAGKSLTVERLLNEGKKPRKFDSNATPGIAISDREYDLPDGRHVTVHFWDFGGQEILHSMHRMFLTERTLYVVLINARDDTQDDRARYWLHNVKSFAGNCPVLMVLNKIDQNPNASVNETALRALYPNLKQVIRLSALRNSQKQFNEFFTMPMLELISGIDSISAYFPSSWQKLKQELQSMQQPYIRGEYYTQLTQKYGILDETLRKDLLNWFNDLGVSFCYGGNARLKDYVILRPDWITNAIYTILWNQRPDTTNGMISVEEIYRLLHPSEEERQNIHMVRKDLDYQPEETEFVLNVVRRFRLSFRVNDDMEFIPALCQRNALPIAAVYEADDQTLEFRLDYEYLPNNVLHRLMVELRQDLNVRQVWLTGAQFEQKRNNVSALVVAEGNSLRIFVRGTKLCPPNTYLNTIRDALDNIHRDMNLADPRVMVIYKRDGKRDEFSYNNVIGSMRQGVTSLYSEKLDTMIPIEDILNQTDSRIVLERKNLLKNIAVACTQLQSKSAFLDHKEDIRNSDLRDALKNMGYDITDQTLVGAAPSGKRPNELDLLIRRSSGEPWTILEALNVSPDTALSYWDKHLNKLLGRYNVWGLQTLILISYVTCDERAFPFLFEKYSEHMRWFDPQDCERQKDSYEVFYPMLDQVNYLQAAKCTYDRSGMPATVYHFFIRMEHKHTT